MSAQNTSSLKVLISLAPRTPLILAMTRDGLHRKYAGSLFGKAWHLLYPLLFLALYSGAHVYVFKARMGGFEGVDYALAVFSGLLVYLCLSEIVTQASWVMAQNAELLKNSRLQPELLPLRIVLTAVCGQAISLALLAVVLAFRGHLGWNALLVFPALVLETLFFTGVAWFLAPLGALVPDVKTALPLVLLFLLFVTPFSYTLEMVSSPAMQRALLLNPLYYVLEIFRNAMAFDSPGTPRLWGTFGAMSVSAFIGGHFFFCRLKTHLQDAL